MPWEKNPSVPSLLESAHTIDATIRADEAAANPGPLQPGQAVVSNGEEFPITGGKVTANIGADRTVTFDYTPEGE